MQKVFIVGNLTRDPELRSTKDGIAVCNFTVAVNRRRSGEEQITDFFKVTAWRGLGEVCGKYLEKGKKVSVVGQVSVSAYIGNDKEAHATLELLADDVEFLSPKGSVQESVQTEQQPIQAGGYVQVNEEELPF